jgi:hypothetical protein
MKPILLSIAMLLGAFQGTARAELPARFDKNEIEVNVLKKFISLQSEYDDFYSITSTEIIETIDNTYGLPGYIIQINYTTPNCANNYFQGRAYSAACTDDGCPFGMVYRKCY